MPLRVSLEIVSICFFGSLFLIFLAVRFWRALHQEKISVKLREGGILLGVTGLGILAASFLLPCFDLFGTVLCEGPPQRHWIALTFDDGPNEPATSQILSILKENGIRATFFLVGQNVLRHPEVVQRMRTEGHAIGNHTFTHPALLWMGRSGIQGEIAAWERSAAFLGPLPWRLFRAPHGWKNPLLDSLLREGNYRLIGWTRGVWDSDQPGTEILFERLTRHPKDGEIILLHDGAEARAGVDRRQTVEVLPRIIRYYRDLGFRFVTIPEMLDARTTSAAFSTPSSPPSPPP